VWAPREKEEKGESGLALMEEIEDPFAQLISVPSEVRPVRQASLQSNYFAEHVPTNLMPMPSEPQPEPEERELADLQCYPFTKKVKSDEPNDP
jgi:hypothetical protein